MLVFLCFSSHLVCRYDMVEAEPNNLEVGSTTGITLDSVRDALIRQEDTIIFSLIERAKFPLNSPAYNQSSLSIPGFSGSLVQFLVKETENLQAKVKHATPFFNKLSFQFVLCLLFSRTKTRLYMFHYPCVKRFVWGP